MVVGVALLALLAVALVGGCNDSGAISPDLRASISSSVDPERGPAPRAPDLTAEAAALPASATVGAVVTMGPGAACVTYPDGITTCTSANSSSTRFGGLF